VLSILEKEMDQREKINKEIFETMKRAEQAHLVIKEELKVLKQRINKTIDTRKSKEDFENYIEPNLKGDVGRIKEQEVNTLKDLSPNIKNEKRIPVMNNLSMKIEYI